MTQQNDGFLPDGYKPPVGNYMDFEEGDNPMRILSSAVVGYEYWTEDKKPVRSVEGWDVIPNDARIEQGKDPIRHFWACVVYNYNHKKVQILQLKQKTIMDQIKAYTQNKKWGNPKMYDLTINKTGSGFDTKYQVIPEPPIAPPAKEVLMAFKQKPVNLQALFTGEDPFTTAEGSGDTEIAPERPVSRGTHKATPADVVASVKPVNPLLGETDEDIPPAASARKAGELDEEEQRLRDELGF